MMGGSRGLKGEGRGADGDPLYELWAKKVSTPVVRGLSGQNVCGRSILAVTAWRAQVAVNNHRRDSRRGRGVAVGKAVQLWYQHYEVILRWSR